MAFLDAHEMATLTAWVVRALKRMPPGVRISDPEFANHIDSLIRYHEHIPLDPVDKPPVLGGIGIADRIRSVSTDFYTELYQESGILEWSGTGAGNPERLDAAEWKIPSELGVEYSDIHQGIFNDITKTYLASQDSVAIDAGESFVMKKVVSGIFQPSQFTGLLRVYMQAQLGGNNLQTDTIEYFSEKESTYQLSVNLVGSEVVLQVDSQQVGEWSHLSSGIVRGVVSDPFDYRWVVVSTEADGDDLVVSAKECPIELADHDQARADYEIAAGVDKEKILTYLFAHSTVRTDLFREVGTETVTNQPGGSLSGWKFNNAGDKAAIVLIGTKTSAGGNDYYRSTQVEINFGMSGDNVIISSFVQNPSKDWTAVPIVQMWTPNSDKTTASRAYTIRGLNNPYNYQNWDWEDVPFYCYFDKDDTLIECTFSHENVGGPVYSYKYKYGGDLIPTRTPVTDVAQLLGGYSIQNKGRWMSRLRILSGSTNTIKVGSTTYEQVNNTGELLRYDVSGTGSGTPDATPRDFPQSTWHSFNNPGWHSPDYQSYVDGGPYYDREVYNRHGTQSYTQTTGRVQNSIWCDIYIPLGDAEAVLIGEMEVITPDGATASVTTFSDAIVAQKVSVKKEPGDPWTLVNNAMYVWDEARPNWLPFSSTPTDPEVIEEVPSMFINSREYENVETDYWQSTATYFGRPYNAEDPAAITYLESWRLAAAQGSNIDGPDGGESPVLDMNDYPGVFSGHI